VSAPVLTTKPDYVYVASSWRNSMQPAVIEVLKAAGIPAYDFKNPEAGTGFSWAEVKTPDMADSQVRCENCGQGIVFAAYRDVGGYEPDYDPNDDPIVWRHRNGGYAACGFLDGKFAVPKKGSDWETAADYLKMLDHPRSLEGFNADFDAMKRADTFLLVLPCGKSAHLELGWAIGAGKRTAILLEDPVEPELMYLMADHLSTSVMDLLAWLGVKDA
jgi:hypothetical protein